MMTSHSSLSRHCAKDSAAETRMYSQFSPACSSAWSTSRQSSSESSTIRILSLRSINSTRLQSFVSLRKRLRSAAIVFNCLHNSSMYCRHLRVCNRTSKTTPVVDPAHADLSGVTLLRPGSPVHKPMRYLLSCALMLAASCPAQDSPPRTWVDPDTGHRIFRLTDE